jgi:hypothetical protein
VIPRDPAAVDADELEDATAMERQAEAHGDPVRCPVCGVEVGHLPIEDAARHVLHRSPTDAVVSAYLGIVTDLARLDALQGGTP